MISAYDNHTIQVLYTYGQLAIYLITAFLLSVILYIVSYLFYTTFKRTAYPDKNSPYECGYDAFSDARDTFDIRFYLVAILFLVFDLEVSFLFPWAVSLDTTGWVGYWSMMFFLFILTIGFVYEWKKGALEWF
jgi:NADH:ubiquinone oxidoreductase subunit 3 (subunit A)